MRSTLYLTKSTSFNKYFRMWSEIPCGRSQIVSLVGGRNSWLFGRVITLICFFIDDCHRRMVILAMASGFTSKQEHFLIIIWMFLRRYHNITA